MLSPKQHFSHSHLCHPNILHLMLLENSSISETGQPIDIHSFMSFLGSLPCLQRDHLNEWTPPSSCLSQYCSALMATGNTSTQNHDDQSHPLPNGRSKDEQGSSNPPHGQTGDGGGQTASGVKLVTSSPTIIGDGGREKVAGAGLEEFSFKSTHGLLVLEDVDEDAEDTDATTRDELIMLAHDNPIWMEELTRYLQEEKKEKEQMQNEREARLARWREDMAIQPI